jgi:hypothetical protein
MVKVWSNRKGRVKTPSATGYGLSMPARRPKAYAQTGRAREPDIVASLKATA